MKGVAEMRRPFVFIVWPCAMRDIFDFVGLVGGLVPSRFIVLAHGKCHHGAGGGASSYRMQLRPCFAEALRND